MGGGGAFAACTGTRVYDSTTSAVTSPADGTCCKAAFVATCGEITAGGGAFAACTGTRVYDSTTSAVTSPADGTCCKVADVDGGFSATFGACSVTCGDGVATKACDNPAPAGNGSPCVGDAPTEACNTAACPVAFVATCGEITVGGGAFADSSCTAPRVY